MHDALPYFFREDQVYALDQSKGSSTLLFYIAPFVRVLRLAARHDIKQIYV
jgi:hypothetical protein